MSNPAYNGGFSPNQATNPQSRVNDTPVRGVNSRSTFPMFALRANTERFADITPVFSMSLVGGDSITGSIPCNLRAHTLASPLLQNLRKHYAQFFVPKSCIHPVNYEREKMAPKIGDDIIEYKATGDTDTAAFGNSCVLPLIYMYETLKTSGTDSSLMILYKLMLLRYVFSSGSLINTLGCRTMKIYRTSYSINDPTGTSQPSLLFKYHSADSFLVGLFTNVIESVSFGTGRVLYTFNTSGSDGSRVLDPVAVRDFWDSIETSPISVISNISFNYNMALDSSSRFTAVQVSSIISQIVLPYVAPYIRIDKLVAYQMCVSQFFTNDNVDDLNTSKRWLQSMRSMALLMQPNASVWPTFSYNGDYVDYDVFSQYVLSQIFQRTRVSSSLSSRLEVFRAFFLNLFSYQRSLLYEDYFLSARLSPLAVEQTLPDPYPSVTEQGVLGTVRSILVTRFLNAVNSIPNRIRDYVREVFGYTPEQLSPQPKFINHISVDVFGDEVVNTSEDQGNIETNLQSRNSVNVNVQSSDDGIFLLLTWYDLPRMYANATERDFFHYDRFDDFQPYLQNIGDQPIFSAEYCPGITGYDISDNLEPDSEVVGYLEKDAEYKQLISLANGAFAENNLPSWANVFVDPVSYESPDPDNIRQENSYFDRFYKSLTGSSYGTYYHFIAVYTINLTSSRPMNYSNNILMP